MTNNQEAVISHVLMQIAATTVVSEEDIRKNINVFKILNPLSPEEEEEVVKELPFLATYLVPKCEALGYCTENAKRTCKRKPLKKEVLP